MAPTINIQAEPFDSPNVTLLLQQHFELMLSISPADSVHAIKVTALAELNIQFWTAWVAGRLAGCGALLALDKTQCELKSMHTVLAYRRKGVAVRLLGHIMEQARMQNFDWMRLETGTSEQFAASRALYMQSGFVPCPPFARYRPDPHSCFMEFELFTRSAQVRS